LALRSSCKSLHTDRSTFPLILTARLLLLLGAAGTWVTLVQWAASLSWAGLLGWAIGVFGVLYGVIASIATIAANLRQPGSRTVTYLAFNGCFGAILVAVAFTRADPEPHLAILGVAAIAAGLLTLVAGVSVRPLVKRLTLLGFGLAVGYTCTYALPTTLPFVAAIHLEGVLTTPSNAEGVVRVGAPLGDRGNGTGTYTVDPGTYRVGLACTGYLEPVYRTVQIAVGESVTVSPDCPGRPNISASTDRCSHFPEPLPSPYFGSSQAPFLVVEGSGCGPGQVPANGKSFAVVSGWQVSFAYTCNGWFGDGNRSVIALTAHNMATGADLPALDLNGNAVALGGVRLGGGLAPAPEGPYLIRVTILYPDDNQCKWDLGVYSPVENSVKR
jgi:hypothetical protein